MKHFHVRALAPLMLVFALALNTLAHAKDTAAQAANRRAIVAAYTNSNAAMMRKDVARAVSFLAPDFVYYTMNRTPKDRAAYAQSLVDSLSIPNLRYTLVKTENIKITWRGPDAIVYSDQITQLNGPGGVAYARNKFRDYWGKTSQGWQVRQSVEISGTLTINGRVFSR